MIPQEQFRTVCFECFKPGKLCICDRVTRVENRTRILIIQHPDERNHPIGTARIAALALANSELRIAYPDSEGTLTAGRNNLVNAGILYPAPFARNLSELEPAERPDSLIVLDGTWKQAYKLRKEIHWLAGLPHFMLRPPAPSNYRIRKEPRDDFISTIEAIAQALFVLEPQTPHIQGLLDTFDAMIDDQRECIRNGTGRRKKLRRSPG